MNHIYKLKFDKRRNEIVVVSEITTGPGKVHTSRGTKKNVVSMVNNLARSVLSVLILAGLGSPALAAGLPVGGQVVAGSASIQKPTENQMNIHQNSAHAVLNWNSFDIGQGHTVQFYQPDSSAVALNRVVGGNESHIMGNLNANGRVFLVNPNGVLFGKGASVNTAGLVATTRDIKNEDFMNGKYVFSGQKGQGEVVNQGNLTTTKGGFIVLAGDRVRNSGTIRTPEGRAVLAAAEKVTLQLDNAGLTSVAVNGSVVNSLVENSGLVSASDGQVLLTARGKNMLMNTVLNNSGVVEAQGLSVKDGNIVLDGGDSGVVQHSGTLMADNNRGRGGKVVVEGQHILLDEHSRITATGRQGGGEVYVGGGWQGKDTDIRHAQKVVMLKGANIDVSATEKGNGGTAVLWSDEYTRFHGNIQAKGGQTSGNGGQVETSSHNNLQAFGQVDASAATGRGGEWLLDPADITIVDNGTNTNVTNSTTNSTSVFTPDANATTGQVGVTNINNLLNNGTSVNITTSNSAAGNGSITVNAAINKTNGTDATLTLFADGNITVNKNITSSNGALNVNLFGGNTSNNATVNIGAGVNITTNNGSIAVRTANASNNVVLNVGNGSGNRTILNAGTGEISLEGGRVNLKGANITAGNFSVNATTRGFEISNATVNATDNITLTATTTRSDASGVYLKDANLSSTNGSIIGTGTATANSVSVHLDNNVTLNASQGDITLTGNSAQNKGIFLVRNGNITARNITLNGSTNGSGIAVDIRGQQRITGTNDIRLEGSRVEVRNANITAGNFSVNATTRGFEISNATVNATDNITLTATTTGSDASGVYLKDANLSSTNGSIIGTGTATAGSVAVHLDNNVTLNASQGDITLTGSSDTGSGVVIRNATLNASIGDIALNGAVNSTYVATGGSQRYGGGVVLTGDNNFDGKNINVNGSAQSGDTRVAGVVFHNNVESNLNVSGNLSIQGDGNNVAGVNVVYRDVNINMASGALNINGVSTNSSGVFFSGVHGQYATTKLNVNLNNSDFTLSGNGGSGGVTGYTYQNQFISGISVQGKGNVTITGNSTDNDGVALHRLDNSNLTGMLKVDGFSENGNGVVASLNSDWHLQNAVITGTSEYGNGITIHAPKGVYSPNIDLGNTTLTGTTVNGSAGVNIDGDNVKLTNGSISGVASSQGGGVSLTGGSNYSVSGVNVTGSSANGTGISVNGSLEVGGNSTLNGTSTGNGTGVQIGGNLTSNGGASITGTASSGDGVQVSGNVEATGGNVSVTGNSDSGFGVNIQGNTSLENTMVTGSTQTGTGVNITGNLTNTGSSSVTGTSQQGGTGVDLGGNVSGGSVTGSSATGSGVTVSGSSATINNVAVSGSTQSGSGVTVTGNLTNGGGGTLTGTAAGSGTGVTVSGADSVLADVALSGSSATGTGVNITGNLTNTGSSSVTGTSQQGGTGVDLGGNVSGGSVTGSSATGSGVTVSGSSATINNVAVSGSTQSGSGVTVTGNLTNGGSSSVSGSASGNGSGVTLAGNVSGGSLSGYSHDGEGVNVSGNSQINGVALQASTTNGVALAVQNNVTLGQQGSTVSATVTEGGQGQAQSGGNSPEGQLIRAGNEWQSVYYQSGKQAYGNRLMEAGAKAEAQADIELCLDDGECRKESLAVTQVGDKGQQGARK